MLCKRRQRWPKGKISFVDFLKYSIENNDEYREHFEKNWHLFTDDQETREFVDQYFMKKKGIIRMEDLQVKDSATSKATQETLAQDTSQNISTTDQERIKKWRERKQKEGSNFEYIIDDSNNSATYKENPKVIAATIAAATGFISADYSCLALTQAHAALHRYECPNQTAFNAIQETLLSMAPQDDIEGMLCREF